MNRLLKIVDYWYGEQTRRRVFEPLLADFDNDVRRDRSLAARVRWWLAVASTLVACVPRSTFGGIPLSLATDLVVRAVGFGGFAVGLQWGAAQITRDPIHAPMSLTTTAPFVILAVIWRIRTSELPMHQRRLLACVIAGAAALAVSLAADQWIVRLALAFAPLSVGVFGWRLGTRRLPTYSSAVAETWVRVAIIASVLQISVWPLGIALGIGYNGLWPNHFLVTYIAGFAMYGSMRTVMRATNKS